LVFISVSWISIDLSISIDLVFISFSLIFIDFHWFR
jgi:hypothetical protein